MGKIDSAIAWDEDKYHITFDGDASIGIITIQNNDYISPKKRRRRYLFV